MSFPKPERFPVWDQALTLRAKALCHPARLNILRQLSMADRMCVLDLSASIPLTTMTVSGHLKILRRSGLLDVEEQGLYNYYSLRPGALERLVSDFGEFFEGLGLIGLEVGEVAISK